MHIHLWDRKDLALSLTYGITSVRNMGGMPMHLRWRNELHKEEWLGSNLYTASPRELTGTALSDVGKTPLSCLSAEGIFFGSMSFIAKASVGVGVQLSGILLDLVGLVPGTAPEEVATSVSRNLGLAYVFVVVLIIGAGLLVISRFDLTRERHGEIQARLRGTRAG
jgi:hypothetical protein